MRKDVVLAGLPEILGRAAGEEHIEVLGLEGEREAADASGQPWLDVKYGSRSSDEWHGVVPVTVTYRVPHSDAPRMLSLVVKVNPRRGIGETLIPWIIETRGIELSKPFSDYSASAEFSRTAGRESTLYGVGQNISSLSRILPRLYGMIPDESIGEEALVIERVEDIAGLDASGRRLDWSFEEIQVALRAAADFHAEFSGRENELSWAGPRVYTPEMLEDSSLWEGILEDSHRRFPDIVTDEVFRRRQRIIQTIGEWHPAKDAVSTTLVHDDFNPRNVGFRKGPPTRPLVLDWELAKRGSPLRDVVELLTFVTVPSTTREAVDELLASYKDAAAAAGAVHDDDLFLEAFRAELRVEAVNRVGFQALFGAAFPLPYLSRINSAIEHLLSLFD